MRQIVMQKKGMSLSFETIVIFIIILVVLALILLFIIPNYNNLFGFLSDKANATTSLAESVSLPKA